MLHHHSEKKRRAASFLSNREGAVSIIFGLTIILLIVLIGGVIDFGMAMVSRTQSQAATDAAALAIALPLGQPNVVGRRYFETNYPFATSGVSRTYDDISVNIQPDRVTVESVANMQTSWLNVGGINEVGVNALTVVSRNRIPVPPDLDMVLVLDTSGSMECGIDQNSVDFGLPNSCYPFILADGEKWGPLPTSAPIRKDQMLPAAKDLVARIMGDGSPVIRMGVVSYSNETRQAFGLDSDPNNVRNRIDGSVFEGSTCGACGMNSAREILTSSSPAPVTGRPDGRPLSQVRHVVFLTDGEQNCRLPGDPMSADFNDPYTDPPTPTTYVNCEYSFVWGDGNRYEGGLPDGDPAPLNDLRNQCNALKAEGVTISTIAFGPDVANPSSANSATLRDCASPKLDGSGPQFYLVSNYAELSNVFTEIGVTLGKLRITQ